MSEGKRRGRGMEREGNGERKGEERKREGRERRGKGGEESWYPHFLDESYAPGCALYCACELKPRG